MTPPGRRTLTRREALLAGVVPLLAAVGGCDGPAAEGTAPGPPTATAAVPRGPVRSGLVAFGDSGGGPAQPAVARAMERWAATHRVDALVTTGDNVYERGEPELFAAQLDQPYRTLRRGRPLWATLGNHDVSAGHGAEQLRHLGLPDLPYAKSLPGLQLLFLDANRVDQAQASWLDARLSTLRRTCGRWCSTTRPGRAASTTPASRLAGTGCRCSRATGSRSCSTATTTTTSASSRPGG